MGDRLSRALAVLGAIACTLCAACARGNSSNGTTTTVLPVTPSPAPTTLVPSPAPVTSSSTASPPPVASTSHGWFAVNAGLSSSNVVALAIDSTQNFLYAATDAGVFRSTDGGQTWSAANNGLASVLQFPQVFALGPPSSTQPAVLYGGTSDGVYRSSDGASSWTAANTGLSNTVVNALAVDPSSGGDTVLAATDVSVVYKTTDGGQTWSQESTSISTAFAVASASATPPPGAGTTVPASPSSGSMPVVTNALALDSSTPSVLFCATARGGGWGCPSLFSSKDAGATWALGAGVAPFSEIVSLAIVPSSGASPRIVYAGGDDGIARTTDDGASWTVLNTGLTDFQLTKALVVDPSSATTVYAGAWQANVGLPDDGGVLKTTDGGATWSAVNTGLTTRRVVALAIDARTPGVVYAGTRGGGVFKTTTGGQ